MESATDQLPVSIQNQPLLSTSETCQLCLIGSAKLARMRHIWRMPIEIMKSVLSVHRKETIPVYLMSVKWENTVASVLATVDMVLMKMSSATPTTSLRVSPTVSPVTAALCAAEPLP